MKAVHFGAGSIGRGFIGDLLHESGYDIVFIDIDPDLLAEVNSTGSYDFRLIEDDYRTRTIDRVRGVSSLENPLEVIAEIATADIITTSVWADNLKHIAPILGEGLRERMSRGGARVSVVACENAMRSSEVLRARILERADITADELDAVATFPNTAVDRLVLESRDNGRRVLDVGRDHELVIDRTALVDPQSTPITGAVYTDDVIPYIERKLYIINCGHAWAGYIGHLQGYTIMQDIFANDDLREQMRAAMRESAEVIHHKHKFDPDSLEEYIDFAINRFRIPGVIDIVPRVCRSPIRKLGTDERFIGPALQAVAAGTPYGHLARGIAAVFRFDNPDDPQSVELLAEVSERGIAAAVTHRTGQPPQSALHQAIVAAYEQEDAS
ncbi:mannitol dehydrogenase [Glycomyces tenuis]|uniref:mannitol dehydrogenase family protein n=1 Tax=Glycomyces tenuis TaxID=58116 RepID=UPI00042316F3|nr:mannitol dehydrogenase [Glycomyces tenuis]